MTLLLFIWLLPSHSSVMETSITSLNFLGKEKAFLAVSIKTPFSTNKTVPEIPYEKKALLGIPPSLFYAIAI